MNFTLQKGIIFAIGVLASVAAVIEYRFLQLPPSTTGFVYLLPYLILSAILSLVSPRTRLFGIWGLLGMIVGFAVTIIGVFVYGLFR